MRERERERERDRCGGWVKLSRYIPISYTRPENPEQPGPPVSQSTRGSSSGLLSDSMK